MASDEYSHPSTPYKNGHVNASASVTHWIMATIETPYMKMVGLKVSAQGGGAYICAYGAKYSSCSQTLSIDNVLAEYYSTTCTAATDTAAADSDNGYGVKTLLYDVLEPVLLHRYSFNDGTTVDAIGGPSTSASNVGATFRRGQAVFNADAGSYMTMPVNAMQSSRYITIEMWVSTPQDSHPSFRRFFSFGPNTFSLDGCLNFGCSDTGMLYLFAGDNTDTDVSYFGKTNQHIAIVIVDGQPPEVYINGALKAVADIPFSLTDSSDNYFMLGTSLYYNEYFNGTMDEFRIWKGALTADAVIASYRAGPDANSLEGNDGMTIRAFFAITRFNDD